MRESLITIADIAASALFILSLSGLSRQETAQYGNLYGMIALVATAVVLVGFAIYRGEHQKIEYLVHCPF